MKIAQEDGGAKEEKTFLVYGLAKNGEEIGRKGSSRPS